MSILVTGFKERLQRYVSVDFEIVVNENRSTMLNFLRTKNTQRRLSVHKMFLTAPEPVLSAIGYYVKGKRRDSSVLRRYIQDYLSCADYTHLVDPKKLVTQGRIYDLKSLYDVLNNRYFDGKLELAITWYGSHKKKKRRHITFGQYVPGMRLIKIHRLMDDPSFPDFFVSFVIYHEMLHSIVDATVDQKGRYCFHNAAFRAREKAFEHYRLAREWEKNNKARLYGWS